jgi:uncharacterized membrane protein YphA (DoxX/SURF4 family)
MKSIALWTLQLVVAALFLLAGGMKLAGAPVEVQLFAAIGVGQWFRYLTGMIEVAGALALLVPRGAAFGGLTLSAVMIGALATHLFLVGGNPAPAFALFFASLAVVWLRREQISSAHARA